MFATGRLVAIDRQNGKSATWINKKWNVFCVDVCTGILREYTKFPAIPGLNNSI